MVTRAEAILVILVGVMPNSIHKNFRICELQFGSDFRMLGVKTKLQSSVAQWGG